MNDLSFEPQDQHLQSAWLELEQQFRSAEMVKPKTGFSRRWLHNLQAAYAREARQRTTWLVIANSAATLALFLLLLPGLRPVLAQPGSFLAGMINAATQVTAVVLVVLNTIASVVNTLPASVWLVVGTSSVALLLFSAMLFSKMNWIKGDLE